MQLSRLSESFDHVDCLVIDVREMQEFEPEQFSEFLKLWKLVLELKNSLRVGRIGVSGMNGRRLAELLDVSRIDHVFAAKGDPELQKKIELSKIHDFVVYSGLGSFPSFPECCEERVEWIARYSLIAKENSILLSRGYISQHQV